MTLLGEKRVEFPPVLNLNVGGRHFTTRLTYWLLIKIFMIFINVLFSLATVTRFNSMISSMFSGRHFVPIDESGRYFIDRDGAIFGKFSAFQTFQKLDF